MPEPRGRSLSAPWLLKILLLSLAGLAAAFLVVRAAAPRGLPPGLAEKIGVSNPDQLFRSAGREFVANQGRLTDGTYAALMEAATDSPMAAEPFMFAAVKALERGDLRAGEQLLTFARARNPRQSFVRLALLGIYLRTNRIAPAAEEVQALVRLLPQAEQVLVPELARLAARPETRPVMVQAFGADSIMASVLDVMAAQNAAPELLLQLAARQPAAANGQLRPWQRKVLDSFIDRGQLGQAYDFWRRASGAPQGERPPIYDAGFQGLPGGAPFNWKLAEGGVGAAERSQGALSVEFFGRSSGPLAEQLLLLSPGRYRLSFRAEGNANAQGSRILWQVECRGTGNKLLEIVLEGVTFSPKEFAGEFTVPAGCSAQWLRLVGAAAEFPATQSAKISALTLSRRGG